MAINQSIRRTYKAGAKEVSYLAKNFIDYRQDLIEFAKSYYPTTYADFNEASPGMMFIEMAAYVGDVLSFYVDNQFKENLIMHAQERKNILRIAQGFGYKPRLSAPATVEAVLYQTVPALGADKNYDPDQRFFLDILSNSAFSSNTAPSVAFRSTENVSFADSKNRTVKVLARDGSGVPTTYLVSKPIQLTAGTVKTADYSFGTAEKFQKIVLPDSDVISIVSVVDSDGYDWTEVDFLGQDVVIEERDVTLRQADGNLADTALESGSLPPAKLAVFRKKPRRFVTRVNEDLEMELWFGSGTQTADAEILQLDASQIANSKYDQNVSNSALDPSDFLTSDTFGLAPSNTTLTVTYMVGGGVETNTPSRTIVNVDLANVKQTIDEFAVADQAQFSQTVDSIAVNNFEPATGGGDVESVEEIRQNTLAYFNAQNRVVTNHDYVVRTLAMPPKFGSVAKAFVMRDEQISLNSEESAKEKILPQNVDENPFNNRRYVDDPIQPNAINLYVLGHNAAGNLTTLNSLVKKNLAKYLEQFRVLTDDVNILDAFVVNIGVEFEVIAYRDYNLNDVLARCIDAINEFFDIDFWHINQPVVMNDLRLTIGSVDGVQTVTTVKVFNKYRFRHGRDYSNYRYPISEALVNDIIYPSLDPCVFEIRYPDTDIVGNAIQ